MSFNITSDGSPTPRKGPARLSMTGDLKIDTSLDALEQAVGGMSLNQYPHTLYRTFGSSLTSNLQGLKRPLGTSTLSNQTSLPQQSEFDGYKVR